MSNERLQKLEEAIHAIGGELHVIGLNVSAEVLALIAAYRAKEAA